MFKKEDLKNGMIVEYKDGEKSIRINNKLYYLTTKDFDNISEFNEDLTHESNDDGDIIRVFEINTNKAKGIIDFNNDENLKLVWEREINWYKVPEWTKVQVKDNSNSEWQNAYYIIYNLKSDGEYNHCITQRDKFTNPMGYIDGDYKYCRIHPDVEIKKEWYKS